MTTKIGGWASPAGGGNNYFPDDQAATIVYAADQLSEYLNPGDIRFWLSKIRALLGHIDTMSNLELAWGRDAEGAIRDAQQEMGSVVADLGSHWEGDAFTSFRAYLMGDGPTSITTAIKNIADCMDKMANLIRDLRDQIYELYKAGFDFIIKCYNDVLEFVHDIEWFGELAQIGESIFRGAIKALQGFITNIRELGDSVIDRLKNIVDDANQMERTARAITVPDRPPDSIAVDGDWKRK